jgi:hypothetical protein
VYYCYNVYSWVKKEKEEKKENGEETEKPLKKWQQVTWWYVDYKQFVDIVKVKEVKDNEGLTWTVQDL